MTQKGRKLVNDRQRTALSYIPSSLWPLTVQSGLDM